MNLEERLRELMGAESMLEEGDKFLRQALIKDKRSYTARQNLITEALFKVRGSMATVRRLRQSAEAKQKRKSGGGGVA